MSSATAAAVASTAPNTVRISRVVTAGEMSDENPQKRTPHGDIEEVRHRRLFVCRKSAAAIAPRGEVG